MRSSATRNALLYYVWQFRVGFVTGVAEMPDGRSTQCVSIYLNRRVIQPARKLGRVGRPPPNDPAD